MDLREFLGQLRDVRGPNDTGEYVCRCPAHDDSTASLCVMQGDRGIVLKCQAGCDTLAVLRAMGLSMRDLFPATGKRGAPAAQIRPATARNAVRDPGGAAQAIPSKTNSKISSPGEFVCAYPYEDENGKILYEVVRYKTADGKTFRQRVPDPAARGGYRNSMTGVRLVLYRLPDVVRAIKSGTPVIVVEGEKDADNLAEMGYTATTSPMGAGKWRREYNDMLRDADVYIIPDNDDVGRQHAETIATGLAGVSKSVRVVQLRDGWPGIPVKGDVTDMFAALGKRPAREVLLKLMRAAMPREITTAQKLAQITQYYNGVPGYCVENGCICKWGNESNKPLSTFVAYPSADISRDNGVTTEKMIEMQGWTRDGKPLPTARVPADKFAAMNWLLPEWGFAGNIYPGNAVREQLRYAMAEIGRITAERRTEYVHTGWRRINGEWAFLYHGGAIGADKINVDLGSALARYSLGGADGIDLADAVAHSMAMQNCMNESVSVPLLGMMYLAPLREPLAATGNGPAFSLFLLGGTGVRKSTAAALALSHYGDFNGRSLPASFNDTANAIRQKAFTLKDLPMVVDDYHPSASQQERKRMETIAQNLARAFGDGADRSRMRADLTMQDATPPRCLSIISGEDLPSIGQSGTARYYVVNIEKNDVPADVALTNMQAAARAGKLRRAMGGYIEWLIPQMDSLPEKLAARYDALRTRARDAIGPDAHGRTPEQVAHIMLGYGMMCQYATAQGVIDMDDAEVMTERAWGTITENSRKQCAESRDERPTRMYLGAVAELISTGAAGIIDLTDMNTGGPPMNMIGYCDKLYYYLLPETAYAAVCKLYTTQGQAFPLTMKMLNKQLRADGLVDPDGTTQRTTKIKCISGRAHRLLWIPRGSIDGKTPGQQIDMFDAVADPDQPF